MAVHGVGDIQFALEQMLEATPVEMRDLVLNTIPKDMAPGFEEGLHALALEPSNESFDAIRERWRSAGRALVPKGLADPVARMGDSRPGDPDYQRAFDEMREGAVGNETPREQLPADIVTSVVRFYEAVAQPHSRDAMSDPEDLVCSLVTTPPPPDAPPPVHASVLAFTLVETMLDLFKTEPGSFELTVGMLRGDRRLAPPP
ncbi:MAG: hypothetical protein ACKVPX_06610 [Myxococcaceae bacterium]